MARHNALTPLGLAVTHYAPSEIGRAGWCDEVTAWLRARAAELRVDCPSARGVIRPRPGKSPAPFVVG
jgi:hypothetical protein